MFPLQGKIPYINYKAVPNQGTIPVHPKKLWYPIKEQSRYTQKNYDVIINKMVYYYYYIRHGTFGLEGHLGLCRKIRLKQLQ